MTITTPAHDGKPATRTSEVIHTTSEHPFLIAEQGFVPAGKLKEGMHVQRADGSVGVITGWKQVAGTKTMYNLEVLQDHTFAVGEGEWVVHNQCGPVGSSNGGPGIWEQVNEFMSNRAARYQQQITGCADPGLVYRVNGVKFDGFDGTNLLDAKGPGYAKFVDPSTGAFKTWWRGADALVDEASRQVGAAGSWSIIWHIAENMAFTAIQDLLAAKNISGVNLCLTPPVP